MARLKKCLFVLGCGRSGTSVLTRMLVDNGYQIPANHTSNWEDPRIARVNDKILDSEGFNWYNVNRPINNIRTPEIMKEIETIIEDYQQFENPVIKCPRMLFLINVWERFVITPEFLGIYRDQRQVVDSINRKHPGISLNEAYNCWMNYNQQLSKLNHHWEIPVLDLNSPRFLTEAKILFNNCLGIRNFDGSSFSESRVHANVRKEGN